jgi:hypothetical protein
MRDHGRGDRKDVVQPSGWLGQQRQNVSTLSFVARNPSRCALTDASLRTSLAARRKP